MNETPQFYRNTTGVFIVLLLATLVTGLFCAKQTFLDDSLLPAPKSLFPWNAIAHTDQDQGGASTLAINEATYSLNYTFIINDGAQYPYASLAILFNAENAENGLIDLSRYSTLKLSVNCSPANVISLAVYTHDPKITDLNDPASYRIPMTFFSCEEKWQDVVIDLKHLEVPEWWLRLHKFALSDRGYRLDRVSRIAFGNSAQSPLNTSSQVKIAELRLQGESWRYIFIFAALATLIWLGFGFWVFKQYTKTLIAELQQKVQKDRPLVAYQQLSIEPHKDKEKQNVLRYMATEYPNPDLSLDTIISATGINRAKINTILKDEIGLTFSAYINKLRLTEAARILSEKPEASVAEIAYSVGYNNVTYFNKLFKNEYGCSPKTFKTVYKENSAGEDSSSG